MHKYSRSRTSLPGKSTTDYDDPGENSIPDPVRISKRMNSHAIDSLNISIREPSLLQSMLDTEVPSEIVAHDDINMSSDIQTQDTDSIEETLAILRSSPAQLKDPESDPSFIQKYYSADLLALSGGPPHNLQNQTSAENISVEKSLETIFATLTPKLSVDFSPSSILDRQKDVPLHKPLLKYNNSVEYCRRMSTLVYLEDAHNLRSGQSFVLEPGEFVISEGKKRDSHDAKVILTVPHTETSEKKVNLRFRDRSTLTHDADLLSKALNRACVVFFEGDEMIWFGVLDRPRGRRKPRKSDAGTASSPSSDATSEVVSESDMSPISGSESESVSPSDFKNDSKDDSQPSSASAAQSDGLQAGDLLRKAVHLYFGTDLQKESLIRAAKANTLSVMFLSSQANHIFKAISKVRKSQFRKFLLGKSDITHKKEHPKLELTEDKFNDSQHAAINAVVEEEISFVQGPPGTGKTSVIYEIIQQFLLKKQYPIVVVVASNVAVDNIAEKLIAKDADSVMRLTATGRELEYKDSHVLSPICFHKRFYDASESTLQELIRKVRNNSSDLTSKDRKRVKLAKRKFLGSELKKRKVILATTMTAANFMDQNLKFPVVIMDEATQSSEPASLIPITLPSVEKVIFVGDQRQLSCFSRVKALSLSLFERVMRNGTLKSPKLLDTQYRMHPEISEFPRNEFYQGMLQDGITAADRKIDGIPKNPLVFWDTCGASREMRTFPENPDHSNSPIDSTEHATFKNSGEAYKIEQVVEYLIRKKNVKRSQIGIITPYRGQRNEICSRLLENRFINPESADVQNETRQDSDEFTNASNKLTIQYVSGVMLGSVDAFQGRERDFIIFSCVRSNNRNEIGFLSDPRRLNVALTRAKYGLILVGDAQFLKGTCDMWANFIGHLEKTDSVLRSAKFRYG